MKNIILLSIFSLLIANCELLSQDNGWEPSLDSNLLHKVTKMDEKIRYTVDSTMELSQRNEIVRKTKEYIADNLRFIKETNFEDSIWVIIVYDRNEMKKYVNRAVGGIVISKNSFISMDHVLAIHNEGYSSLKHELMHVVSRSKWGDIGGFQLRWLSEGLAMLADPDIDNCESLNFEKKYAYFLQTNKLISTEDLIFSTSDLKMPEVKIFYAQSAYIVEYLLKNYGLDKVKQQWGLPMDSFSEIFGLAFDELISRINTDMREKYPDPVELDWNKFNQRTF